MLVPIVCITCGCPIGDVADLYRVLRAKRVKEVLAKTSRTPFHASGDLQIDCTDIFDRLKIRSPCCRTHLTTSMVFTDYY